MREFAELIKRERIKRRLSQQDLGDKCKMSRGTIMHIESNNQNVSLSQALLLSEVLEFSLDGLRETRRGYENE